MRNRRREFDTIGQCDIHRQLIDWHSRTFDLADWIGSLKIVRRVGSVRYVTGVGLVSWPCHRMDECGWTVGPIGSALGGDGYSSGCRRILDGVRARHDG